ncbi:Ltp family lipoprotein [Levilactobacillus tangyuanensis]|uniref:Ltp family lipoprotein n=1 Tax=Levilactobacillus tangyuanensis TaxID=2486021 RepID=A0ABW1TL09_9LACO|nr:Ltp family lipoprotein [Levilactobacillus tangyuanensis]
MKRITTITITLLASLSLAACSSSNDAADDTSTDSTSEETTSQIASSKKKNDVPTEYQSALNKAEDYAGSMDMSEQGVYDQLTSDAGEQFSEKAATYAMKHLTDIDWKANALAKAKSYQKDMDMSPDAIRDQLSSSAGEQFTEAQADYAIQHLDS